MWGKQGHNIDYLQILICRAITLPKTLQCNICLHILKGGTGANYLCYVIKENANKFKMLGKDKMDLSAGWARKVRARAF